MFCMGRAEFPVDTHVWEISKQLGWVPGAATREQTYEQLNVRVPDDIKYDLHVLLVQHGKVCPACGKRGTPQKRKAAAAVAAVPCPLAAFKRGKRSSSSCAELGSTNVVASSADASVTSNGCEQKAQVQLTADGVTAAEAIAAAFSVKQPRRQQQPEGDASLQQLEAGVGNSVSVKTEPSLLAIKAEGADTGVAVCQATCIAAAARAGAGGGLVKPETVD
eukprot:GHUV01024482.1.p2 GENE.GHUV01024482.1~~GHUV01024482.1.p2  ORF type:complete len:220 (+),score=85.67 GHUV01024482.1:606-1265(+)